MWKLNLHYFDWANTLDDSEFVELVDDWILHNRPYEDGYWLDSWNSYALSIRVVAWMENLAKRMGGLSVPFIERVERSIHEQLRFLADNIESDIGGNHLIKNIKAFLWGGRYFTGKPSAVMLARAEQLLEAELPRQILADGFHFELSPAYHAQVFSDLMDCWRLLRACALKERLGAHLEAMAQVAADMTHPDGKIALFNDGGLNMSRPTQELLDKYAGLLRRAAPVAGSVAVFPQAGYFVWRRERLSIFYDAGRVGPDGLPAHAHGDIFSFELSIGDDRFIVDAGVYEYNSGVRRERSRSTAVHNTLTLDGLDQCEFWGAFRMGRRARVRLREVVASPEQLIIDAEHDGYRYLQGAPTHRRRLECVDQRLRVLDEIIGGKGQDARARLLLHPGVNTIIENDHRIILENVRGMRAELIVNSGAATVEDAVWWPDFGCEVATRAITIAYGTAPIITGFDLQLLPG